MCDSRCRGGATSGDRGREIPSHRALTWVPIAAALAALAWPGPGPAGARAQEPAKPAPEDPAAGSAQPLSLRYRFSEKYAAAENPTRPELLVQYQVGAIETMRVETEKAQGAPDRVEVTYRSIYTERPAKVGRFNEVLDAVRRYESFRVGGARQADARLAELFKNHLTIWYHPRGTGTPELISLVENRPIRQEEYDVVVDQPFLPRLMAVMPQQTVRVDDTWSISRQAAQALLGKIPEAGDFALEGRLIKVAKADQGTALTATIEISGELALAEGQGAVRARLSFVFEPPAAEPAAEPKETTGRTRDAAAARDSGVVEARGYIAKLSMGRRQTVPLDEKGRLQEIRTRELVLQRRLGAGPAGAPEAALTVPDTAPKADVANSWLLYEDPAGRFHFLHPQEFIIDVHEPDRIEMTYARPGGGLDALIVLPAAKQQDPLKERQLRDPQAFVKELKEVWLRNGHVVLMGATDWLPDAEWAPRKRKVYRVEAAIKPKQEALGGRNVARFYLDAYLVLFERNDCIRLEALTDRENHVILRDQAEKLVASLELGPAAPGGAGAPSQPLFPQSSPTRPAADLPVPSSPPGGRP